MASLEDVFDIVNSAIDTAFTQEKYQLNFYEYLQGENLKKDEILKFIDSSLGVAITYQIEEIEMYLGGGDRAAFVRESYNWMGKPRARKVKEYLEKIMEDARKYEQSKRRGRKPGSKNRKKATATSDK
jgi:hypothetical protein